MVEVQASVVTVAPVEAIVRVLLDAEKAPLWTDGLERLEPVEGVVGEPGSVGRAVYRGSFGRTIEMRDTLEAVDPGRYYRSTVRGGGISAIVETSLEPLESGSRISLRWRGSGSHLAANVTMRFLRRGIQRRATADLERLAALAESEAAA